MLQRKREKFRIDNRRNDLEKCFQKKREHKPELQPEIIFEYCYNPESVLGKGSYCEVYAGWKIENKNKKVAVRVMPSNSRTKREIEIQKSLKSKYIAQVYADYEQNDKHYVIMELCDESLSKRYKDLSRVEAIQCFQNILNGMEELNKHHIIHRDLKLDNILVKKKQVLLLQKQIKITDFGFAKRVSNGLDTESVKCGTPETMAPELHNSSNDELLRYTDKQDVWALGVMLHQLFYKVHPFTSKESLLKNERVENSDTDAVIDNFIDGCLKLEEERMSLKQVLSHPVRKYRDPQGVSDEPTLFEQFKSCVQNKLENITHYCVETVKGYFK